MLTTTTLTHLRELATELQRQADQLRADVALLHHGQRPAFLPAVRDLQLMATRAQQLVDGEEEQASAAAKFRINLPADWS